MGSELFHWWGLSFSIGGVSFSIGGGILHRGVPFLRCGVECCAAKQDVVPALAIGTRY